MTDEMRYPDDESDLTAEQMDAIMASADEVEIVSTPPLVQVVGDLELDRMVPLRPELVGVGGVGVVEVAPVPANR